MHMRLRTRFGAKVTCLAVLAAVLGGHTAFAAISGGGAPATTAPRPERANLKREGASLEVRNFADWIVDSQNNGGLPFAVVDKINAHVFVFFADGRLRGAAPALLGSASGDDSVPGIGDRKLSSIRPDERTTPAGRFVAEMGRNMRGEEILWVDYDAAVSLHRVITSNPKEHREQRLATPTPADNRITYGCINVSEAFYLTVVHPMFFGTRAIVYVLPETRSVQDVFRSYLVADQAN